MPLFKQLYPKSNTLVWETGTTLNIKNHRSQASFSLDGVVAREAIACLRTGQWTARLQALTQSTPLGETLKSLVEDKGQLPLTPASAISYNGFDTLFLELTGTCNERCLHCYAGSGPQIKDSLNREQCLQVLDDAQVLNFSRIQLTGGDPLICTFLPELVERIDAMEDTYCEIYTNGLLLSDALVKQLIPFNPSLAFSYYSSDPTVHDSITRVPGSQKKTLAAIKRALAAGLDVRTATVIMEENQHLAEETMDSLRAIGIKNPSYSRSFSVGRGDHFEGEMANESHDHRHKPAPPMAKKTPEDIKNKPREKHGKLCVNYEGKVIPCIFNRDDILGDINERRLLEIVNNPNIQINPKTQCQSDCQTSLQCTSCRVTWHALRALS